jgi:hypothetical protein
MNCELKTRIEFIDENRGGLGVRLRQRCGAVNAIARAFQRAYRHNGVSTDH